MALDARADLLQGCLQGDSLLLQELLTKPDSQPVDSTDGKQQYAVPASTMGDMLVLTASCGHHGAQPCFCIHASSHGVSLTLSVQLTQL